MAYGVKYELDFTDIKGNKRSVQILKKDYSGAVNPIIGTKSPVIIKYTNDDDFYNPIIGSSCILNLKNTDDITYDEFINFDEREYKIRVNVGVDDPQADINSPLWELADTVWETTDDNWAAATDFQVYWEGYLVSDTFRESIVSNPYDITLRAIDNLGTLDSYLAPDATIETNADGTIKTGAGEQDNTDTAWYYIYRILSYTGLEFDIYVQNNIRKTNENGIIVSSLNNLYQDILINEFALMDNFAKKSAKDVLENILRLTNSRIFQANAAWYVISNSNYYDNSISGTQTGIIGDTEGTGSTEQSDQDQIVYTPIVTTDAVTNKTDTSGTLNGTIADARGLTIIERGFYFGTNANIYGNPKTPSSDTTSSFSVDKTSLTNNTTYYIAAYAKNNTFFEGIGSVITYTTGESITPEPDPVAPELTVLPCNPYNVTNTAMEIKGQVDNVGTSNVTEYGFYFGTDGNNYLNNTKYQIATGQNLSDPFGFVGNTDQAPFNLTLSSGTPYYIKPYAINSIGESVSPDTQDQYTWNAWQLRKQLNNAVQNVPYTSDSRGDEVTISSDGTNCYTIMVGKYLASLSGLPTIDGACAETPEPEPSVTDPNSCVEIVLYRSNDPKVLCCETPTSKVHYIDGQTFLNTTDVTKVYINNDCSTLLGTAQYLSQDLNQYRYFNGTTLENVITCQSSSVDKCSVDVVTPDAFLVENEVRGNQELVQYDGAYTAGDSVVISSDSEFCYTILEEYQAAASPSITITSSCNITPPTPTEDCPDMTFRAQYLLCGDDRVEIIGNNKDEFPEFIKQISTNDCWSFIKKTTQVQSDDEYNLGCTPTSKFETGFISCDDCLGITTEEPQVPAPPPTQAPPEIYYRIYRGLQSDCSADDQIIEVFNQSNDFPAVISNGTVCYESLQDGGNGNAGDVDNFLDFADCTTCQAYVSTTTTQTPTTTQAPCNPISAAVTTVALNACCGAKSTTIYINSTSLATASVIYTNSDCTTVLPAGNYIYTGDLFFWNGTTLQDATCPACP